MGGMAHWVKYLLHMHESMSSHLQNSQKKPDMGERAACNSAWGVRAWRQVDP